MKRPSPSSVRRGIATPALAVVRAFIAAINAHDPAALGAWMTDDHTFIDSGGTVVSGRDAMVAGWTGYYALFPDYAITADTFAARGAIVAVFGTWSATYVGRRGSQPANRVGGPAAWRAEVAGRRIRTWQVYADHTRTLEVMQRDAAGVAPATPAAADTPASIR